jgi:hypothetical protein
MTVLRYPVYIPSKGRADKAYTARMFLKDGVDFKIVVEPQEVTRYAEVLGEDRLLVLPENDRGLVYSRNWIKDHSIAGGHERHWQFDDDIPYMQRAYKGRKIRCSSRAALAALEDFVDRYENIALASFNSDFFVPYVAGFSEMQKPPFHLNFRCYTCFLVLNSLPNRWRYRYNEDTDMTLQVLTAGWCTILLNVFLISTPATMTHGGGQTDIYIDDGRLRMSRQLERVWPGVVTTKRRFRRPQHKVKGTWKFFDTPLKLKPEVNLDDMQPNEYGLELKEVAPVQSDDLRELLR